MGGSTTTVLGFASGDIGTQAALFDKAEDIVGEKSGLDELGQIGAMFDMETSRLLAQRDAILNRINESDLEASRVARESRINKARQTGRSATILSK